MILAAKIGAVAGLVGGRPLASVMGSLARNGDFFYVHLDSVVSVSVNFRDLEDRVTARWAAHFSERLAKSRH